MQCCRVRKRQCDTTIRHGSTSQGTCLYQVSTLAAGDRACEPSRRGAVGLLHQVDVVPPPAALLQGSDVEATRGPPEHACAANDRVLKLSILEGQGHGPERSTGRLELSRPDPSPRLQPQEDVYQAVCYERHVYHVCSGPAPVIMIDGLVSAGQQRAYRHGPHHGSMPSLSTTCVYPVCIKRAIGRARYAPRTSSTRPRLRCCRTGQTARHQAGIRQDLRVCLRSVHDVRSAMRDTYQTCTDTSTTCCMPLVLASVC